MRIQIPRVGADLVLVSHGHFDHNYVQAVTGSPRIVRGLREDGKEFANAGERRGDPRGGASLIP